MSDFRILLFYFSVSGLKCPNDFLKTLVQFSLSQKHSNSRQNILVWGLNCPNHWPVWSLHLGPAAAFRPSPPSFISFISGIWFSGRVVLCYVCFSSNSPIYIFHIWSLVIWKGVLKKALKQTIKDERHISKRKEKTKHLLWIPFWWGDLLRSVRFIRVWHFKFDFLQAWLPSTFD